ncbi:hypothetical protein PaeBR_18825 [Paenibacillus sp. BR2-3]|uniref:hypothetical protein n=1 Tax=Paenibacillus sp. BR2-3 TaxID=3048494 RepID=UPI00397784DB
MSVQIHINGDNAAEAVKELSALASHFGGDQATQAPVTATVISQDWATQANPQPPVQQAATPDYQNYPGQPQWQGQPQQSVPVQQPQGYPQQSVPQQLTANPVGGVPTTAPTYTMEQLGVAAGPLVDAGRSVELTAWINQRGAGALTQLDPTYYGEFATYLRSLGARL